VDVFTAFYFVAIVIEKAIRAPLNQSRKKEKIRERRYTNQEKILLVLLSVAMFFVPILYAATDWLDFANYSLPPWVGWLGMVLIAGAVLVFLACPCRPGTQLVSNARNPGSA
jgi:protein-S-isoprenylcysteine O-methyltransferase Ste14